MSGILAQIRSYQAPTAESSNLREIARRQGALMHDLKRGVRPAHTAPAPVAPVSNTAPAVRATGGRKNRFTFDEADAAVNALNEGFYALPRNTPDSGGNMVTCFKVFKTFKGKRIVQLVGGGNDGGFQEIRLGVDMQVYAAQHIAEDVEAAHILFGISTGTCGVCGRTLTNDASRAAGIGPKCSRKVTG